jgi:methyl-accepting chemotaxis protein
MSQAHTVSIPNMDIPPVPHPSHRKNGDHKNRAAIERSEIFDLIPGLVVVMDRDHTILDLNETAARTAGRSTETCIGLKFWDLFDSPECKAGTCAASQAAKSGTRCEAIARPVVQGKQIDALISAVPRFGQDGEVVGVVELIVPATGDIHMADEIRRLAAAVNMGQLGERIDEAQFDGRYVEGVRAINQIMETMMKPVGMTAGYLDKLSKGVIPEKITTEYAGDFNVIKNDLNACVDVLDGLMEASGVLDRMSVNDLSKKAAENYPGIFGEVCHSANAAQSRVLNATRVLRQVACGDFKKDLEELETVGKRSETDEFVPAFVTMMRSVDTLVEDTQTLADAAVQGKLSTRVDPSRHQGEYRKVIQGINATLDAVIRPLNVAAEYVDNISKGNIPSRITDSYNGDFNAIKNNLNRCIDALNGLTEEMTRMSDAHNAGDIDAAIPAEKFDGVYREMARGVNEMVAGHITVKKKAMACIAEFGKGNFEAPLEKFPGKKAFINNTIEEFRTNLKALITDADLLVQAAVQGKLSTRADASKHGGDFRKIVEGVNATLDAVIGPLQEVGQVLDKMAGGDLTALVASEYAGDFNRLRNTVNAFASQVRTAIQHIGTNANSLVSAAEELNRVSQQMSASADETATQANVVSAASEQVAANVQTVATGADEMGASIKEIAKNTADATRVAMAAVKSAETTNETIGKLGQSSAEIGQVIKVITSIAQQTNLLALNATIEAARAGEAGKGFAVVANEVKELAKETAKATEDISRKIEAIQGDTKSAVTAIGQIGSVIVQINDIQNTIASAVEEQSATTNEISRNLAEAAHGSSDITRNIGGVAEAARSTTAGATDTQKAAQSLERMSAELQDLISQFKY